MGKGYLVFWKEILILIIIDKFQVAGFGGYFIS